MVNAVEYYRDPAVRDRMAEYCGGTGLDPGSCTAEYLVDGDRASVPAGALRSAETAPPASFHAFLDSGRTLYRSLRDHAGTIGLLEIAYTNPDRPGEDHGDASFVFEALEPARQAVRAVFERFRIPFLELMTSRGYSIAARVGRGSAADAQLIAIGRIPDTLAGKYSRPAAGGPSQNPVSRLHGQSCDAMGRLMEYVAHSVLRQAQPQSRIPIVVTDVAVGQGARGRESVVCRIGPYGDPVTMRLARCPFTLHPEETNSSGGEGAAFLACIPTGNQPLHRLLEIRSRVAETIAWARACGSAAIPDGSEGFEHLVEEYRRSRLANFHASYDAVEHDPWPNWPHTYDRLDLGRLPPCIARSLAEPNPHLLDPTNLQALVRTLMGSGWHPRHIAGLVRSKYERDHGWGDLWAHLDASYRADFHVRIYAGLVSTGVDLLLDHNCLSHQQKGYCVKPWCGFSLGEFRL